MLAIFEPSSGPRRCRPLCGASAALAGADRGGGGGGGNAALEEQVAALRAGKETE